MINGLHGYLLTGEKSFVEAYDTANTENDEILQQLTLLITDSSQSKLLAEIKMLNDKWTDEYTEPLKDAKLKNSTAVPNLQAYNRLYKEKYATSNEKELLAKLQQKFKDLTSSEYKIREGRKEAITAAATRTKNLSLVLTIVSIITALIVVFFLVRRIGKRIKQMTFFSNAIAEGDYSVNIADVGKDELSSLGHSLNHMAFELSKNISLLRRSNEELDQYAHIVSHDLKGPLRGISNVISWVEEDHKNELSPKVIEYLELIKGRVSRAENLIEGLLAYARTDKESIEKETVNVNTLVNEILDSLSAKPNVLIEMAKLPVLFTEKLLLAQVFYNLINNGIKYNDKDQKKIIISYSEHADLYEFNVQDNGIGIQEQYFNRIFIIFQTLKERDSFESNGVGLAIVKKILDSKKQVISVTSSPGAGSIFSFTWPKD